MLHRKSNSSVSHAERHIRELFLSRGRDDQNSTTLANTLDKDIQTVFNSIEKFVFELLQNADDAGLSEQAIEIAFTVRGERLMVAHNGKHFDHDDVEAICDNAQRLSRGKEIDAEKTGYKGIGFKSVFVITDCVHIISREYVFRFDRNFPKWQTHSTADVVHRYPWQIIPIWSPPEMIPGIALNQEKVNFILNIRPGIDVKKALDVILNNPQTILFLRHIRSITVDIEGSVHTLRLEKNEHFYSLYKDEQLLSRWMIFKRTIAIPDTVHEEIARLGAHECPEKLKQAQQTCITLAAKCTGEELGALENAPLHCYLPTTVNCGLSFLVNADFLLTADRMQLLDNIWNQFLLQSVASLHIDWLHELASVAETRAQVLVLFTPQIASHIARPFVTAYQFGVNAALQQTAFLASHVDPTVLLTTAEAIVDTTTFYKTFAGIELPLESKLVSYQLQDRAKLQERSKFFRLADLATKIGQYASLHKDLEFQKRLLSFFISKYPCATDVSAALANIPFLLTDGNKLVAPNKLYLPISSTLTSSVSPSPPGSSSSLAPIPHQTRAQLAYPTFLKLGIIHPELSNIDERFAWLKALGAKEITAKQLISDIANTGNWQGGLTIEHSLTALQFIAHLLAAKEITLSDLECLANLPLLTGRGVFRPANTCYLPSSLHPEIDLQAMDIQSDVFIADICLQSIPDVVALNKLLIAMGVKSKIEFFLKHEGQRLNDPSLTLIDKYREYLQYLLTSTNGATNCGTVISYYAECLHLLPSASYAKLFWQAIQKNFQELEKGSVIRFPNRGNEREITSYFVYYLSNTTCIRATDGKLYRCTDFYHPALIKRIKKLGETLGQTDLLNHTFIRMENHYDGAVIDLTDKQASFFQFKQRISAEEFLRFLSIAETSHEHSRLDAYTTILTLIVEQISPAKYYFSEEKSFSAREIEALRRANIKLLAADDTLQPATALHFYPDAIALGEINNHLFLKNFHLLEMEKIARLCNLFGVHLLESSQLTLIHTTCQPNEQLKTQIREALLFAAFVEAFKNKKNGNLTEIFTKWCGKLNQLTLFRVDDLTVSWRNSPSAAFKPKVFLHGNELCYVGESRVTMGRVYKNIASYLEVSDIDFIALAGYSTDERIEYLQANAAGYDALLLIKMLEELRSGLLTTTIESPVASSLATISLSSTPTTHVSGTTSETPVNPKPLENAIQRRVQREISTTSHQPEPWQERLSPCLPILSVFHPEEVECDKISFTSAELHHNPRTSISSSSSYPSVEAESIAPPTATECQPQLQRLPILAIPTGTPSRTLPAPSSGDSSASSWVGPWGERMVFFKLKQHYKTKYPHGTLRETTSGFILQGKDNANADLTLELIWHNKNIESGREVDFEIIKNGRHRVIEVKSTHHANQTIMRFSRNECAAMRAHRDRYRIFCVHNAGQKDNVRITKIKDPSGKMFAGELEPYEVQFKL